MCFKHRSSMKIFPSYHTLLKSLKTENDRIVTIYNHNKVLITFSNFFLIFILAHEKKIESYDVLQKA